MAIAMYAGDETVSAIKIFLTLLIVGGVVALKLRH